MEIICIISDNKDIGSLIEAGLVNLGFRRIQIYMDRFTDKAINYPGNIISIPNSKIDELENKDKLIDRFIDNISGIEFAVAKPYGSTKYVINANENTSKKLIDTYGNQVKCLLVNKNKENLSKELYERVNKTKNITVESSETINDIIVKILK